VNRRAMPAHEVENAPQNPKLRCTFHESSLFTWGQFAWETNMTGPPGGGPPPHAASIAAVQRPGTIASVGSPVSVVAPPEWTMEGLPEEWQVRFRSLREWICQLLIKNQQLRMALMEMKAREPEDDGSGNV
jgi:hypothetical protein